MDYRNAKFIDEYRIDCEIEHPVYGWIPYTLDPSDGDPTVNNGDLLMTMGERADVIPYVAPTEAEALVLAEEQLNLSRGLLTLSFPQLLIGMVTEGWITEAEGNGWLLGNLPTPVLGLIATLPAPMQFAAKARAIRPSEVVRTDPLLVMLGQAQGKSPEQLDQFFMTYRNI